MHKRTIVVPVLVAVLGLAAIGTIVVLQERATVSRTAQLKLSTLKTELSQLQQAPLNANISTGGNRDLSARLLRVGKSEIAAAVRELRQHDPPPVLEQLDASLDANYAVLDHIYRIGVSPTGYDERADRLAGVAASTQAAAAGLLDEAGQVYAQRAARADSRATFGGTGMIVLLLGAFGFLYRKNGRLLDRNAGLLESSRQEALSDALTGLRNRRALVGDLAAGVARASADQPLLLGLFDLDGFKQYNDTYGHPAGDALLARLSERLSASLDGAATAYRMGGDEFCLLATVEPDPSGAGKEMVGRATAALTETGATFKISCSHGTALIPVEASSPEEALRLADQRMYAQKARTASASRATGLIVAEPHIGKALEIQVRRLSA